MFYAHRALLKKEPLFCLGGGPAAQDTPPIAKASATPHAMRSNMPGIRCLVHRRIEGLPPMPPTPMKQGSMDRAKGFTHIPQEIKNKRKRRRIEDETSVHRRPKIETSERRGSMQNHVVDGDGMAASVAASALNLRAPRTWSGRCMRNRETPAGFKPNQPKTDGPTGGLTYPLNASKSCRKPSKTHLLGTVPKTCKTM